MGRKVKSMVTSDRSGHIDRRNADPYQNDAGLKEPCLCQECHSIYRQRRWLVDPKEADRLADAPETHWVVCPACRKIAEKYPEGLLTLEGRYLWQHEEEIRNMLTNEVTRLRQRNPLERVMRMERREEALVIETTDQKLAEHLGRAVQRAHRGELHIDWGGDACRVEWNRQE